MPYISRSRRTELNEQMKNLLDNVDKLNEGELNYIISNLLLNYIQTLPDGINYKNCNSMMGILECAKFELYRKLISPYEDKKINENGPLYPNN